MALDLVIFQATSACNLNCKYCYLSEGSRKVQERMPLDLLDRASQLILRSNLLSQVVTILWHAGEPLAAGLAFFQDALATISSRNIYGRKLVHTIQTNGTLINQQWCDLFKQYEFEIGVSIDGPDFIHDRNRVGWNGGGSHEKAMRGVEFLKRNNLRYATICVLGDYSLDYPDEIFDFFVSHDFYMIGFNLDEIEAANGRSSLLDHPQSFSTTQERYSRFMSRMIDRWKEAKGKVFIREFEQLSSKIALQRLNPGCIPAPDVTQGLRTITIRADGNFTTFSPELAGGTTSDPNAFVVGNIDQLEELEDVVAHPRYLQMRREIKKGIERCQADCGYFALCGGGFPSNKYYENGTFDCADTKHCNIHVKQLADCLLTRFALTPEFSQAISDYRNS